MSTKQTAAPFEEAIAPIVELNQIALGYTERLVELNLSLLRKQAEVVLSGWRDALAVRDPEQARTYLAHQGEIARSVVNEYLADAKAVGELNQEAAEDMRKVVEASMSKAAKKAA